MFKSKVFLNLVGQTHDVLKQYSQMKEQLRMASVRMQEIEKLRAQEIEELCAQYEGKLERLNEQVGALRLERVAATKNQDLSKVFDISVHTKGFFIIKDSSSRCRPR